MIYRLEPLTLSLLTDLELIQLIRRHLRDISMIDPFLLNDSLFNGYLKTIQLKTEKYNRILMKYINDVSEGIDQLFSEVSYLLIMREEIEVYYHEFCDYVVNRSNALNIMPYTASINLLNAARRFFSDRKEIDELKENLKCVVC